MAQRKNPHVGGDVIGDIEARMAKDPEYAAMVQAEFDRLELARGVRAARLERGFSQEKLARLIGTKQPSIAKLESGAVLPTLDVLQRIARALGRQLVVSFKPA